MDFTNLSQMPTKAYQPKEVQKPKPVEKDSYDNKKSEEVEPKDDFKKMVKDLIDSQEQTETVKDKPKKSEDEVILETDIQTGEVVVVSDEQQQQQAIELLVNLLGITPQEAEKMIAQLTQTGKSPELTAIVATLNTEQKQQVFEVLKNVAPKMDKQVVFSEISADKVVKGSEQQKDSFKNQSNQSQNNNQSQSNVKSNIVNTGSKTDGSAKIQAEANFKNTIAQAKSMIKESQHTDDNKVTSENKRTVSSEEIAQLTHRTPQEQIKIDIQSSKYEGMSFKELKDSMMSQVKTGIISKIPAGGKIDTDSEFMIKLNPEGLGEITVKMTKNPAGIALNILAQNSDTHKMLSAELMNLKEALKPYNAHIDQLVEAKDNLSGNFDHLFGGNQQQQHPQDQQSTNRFVGKHNYNPSETEASLVDLMEEISELYTYV